MRIQSPLRICPAISAPAVGGGAASVPVGIADRVAVQVNRNRSLTSLRARTNKPAASGQRPAASVMTCARRPAGARKSASAPPAGSPRPLEPRNGRSRARLFLHTDLALRARRAFAVRRRGGTGRVHPTHACGAIAARCCQAGLLPNVRDRGSACPEPASFRGCRRSCLTGHRARAPEFIGTGPAAGRDARRIRRKMPRFRWRARFARVPSFPERSGGDRGPHGFSAAAVIRNPIRDVCVFDCPRGLPPALRPREARGLTVGQGGLVSRSDHRCVRPLAKSGETGCVQTS